MLSEYSRTKSESLAQINTAMAELQIYFQGIVFYWRTLYISKWRENNIIDLARILGDARTDIEDFV